MNKEYFAGVIYCHHCDRMIDISFKMKWTNKEKIIDATCCYCAKPIKLKLVPFRDYEFVDITFESFQ